MALIVCAVVTILGVAYSIYGMVQTGRGRSAYVVIAIVGILATLAGSICVARLGLPVRSQHGARAACVSNVKALGLALHMYADANDDRLPTATNWASAIQHFCRDVRNFKCPVRSALPGNDYGLNLSCAGLKLSSIPMPGRLLLVAETNSPTLNPIVRSNEDLALNHAAALSIVAADGQVPRQLEMVPIFWDLKHTQRVAAPSAKPMTTLEGLVNWLDHRGYDCPSYAAIWFFVLAIVGEKCCGGALRKVRNASLLAMLAIILMILIIP